jgi:hypothetical protein
VVEETDLTTVHQAQRLAAPELNRVWRIKNSSKRHPYRCVADDDSGGGGFTIQKCQVVLQARSVLLLAAIYCYIASTFVSVCATSPPPMYCCYLPPHHHQINPLLVCPRSNESIAYHLHPAQGPCLLAQPDSPVAQRGLFTTKNIWVTPHDDAQLYPAGTYVLQSSRDSGLGLWTQQVRGSGGECPPPLAPGSEGGL